jgi:hypothetical protein
MYYCHTRLSPSLVLARQTYNSIYITLPYRRLLDLVEPESRTLDKISEVPVHRLSSTRSKTSIEDRRRSARHQESQELGEDEASSTIFPKRSINCLDRKIATDPADSCQL